MTSTSRPAWHNAASASARDTRPDRAVDSRQGVRAHWVGMCKARLRELRPHQDPLALSLIASEMWRDVGVFDAVIAAELECEAWPPEH